MREVEELEHQVVVLDKKNEVLEQQKDVLVKHDLRAETFRMIAKEVAMETKDMKSTAIPMTNLFGGEEYVKVKKSDWNKIQDTFSKAVSRNHLMEKYEQKIYGLEKKAAVITDQIEKLKRMRQNITSRERAARRTMLERINSGSRKCKFNGKRGISNVHNL